MVRPEYVVDDLRRVSSASARTLAKVAGRPFGDLVKRLPGGIDETGESVGLPGRQRSPIVIRDIARDTELRAAASVRALDDIELQSVGIGERLAGEPCDVRIPLRIRGERLDRERLRLGRPTPTGPVDSRRERLLRGCLDRDSDWLCHQASVLNAVAGRGIGALALPGAVTSRAVRNGPITNSAGIH